MHSLKRLTLSISAAGILCLSNLNTTASIARHQAPDLDDRAFIQKVTSQITGELSKADVNDKSALDTSATAAEAAKANLQKLRTEKSAAQALLRTREETLKGARGQYDVMRLENRRGGDSKAAAHEVNNAVTQRDKARESFEALEKAEQDYLLKFEEADANLRKAADAFARNTTHRGYQKATLERLSRQWQANPTADNLIALTDQIAAISCEQNISANPFWKTTPLLGANIYYQSLGERRRKSSPNPINNPTQTRQPICLGKYYIWSERAGKTTSDKDKTFVIYLGVDEIIVVEDR